MAKASDNVFPYLHVAPAAAPASPSAGSQRLYLDSADGNKLKRKDSSGIVTTIEGGSGGAAAFVGARVYNNANVAVANGGSGSILTFNSERFDTDAFHSTSSNTSRLTAPSAGKYHISATVLFAANTSGARGLSLILNGTTNIALERHHPAQTGDTTGITISTVYDLAAGDYIEVQGYQTSGVSLDALAVGNCSPEFMMYKLG